MKITVKTLFGLENVLASELESLGAENIRIGRRAVFVDGDEKLLYRANYELRTALRVLVELKSETVHSFDDIYYAVKRIHWDEYFGLKDSFSIDAVVNSQYFKHSQFVAQRCKDAIADQFRRKTNKRPNVDIKNPDIRINIHIFERDLTISLDSSGASLHKRGYRTRSVAAPLNEVLAAGIIQLTEWDKKATFYDPMCGSGTLPIEAFMLSRKIPAQQYRDKFCFTYWKDFDAVLWEKVKKDADDQRVKTGPIIHGSDILQEAVNVSTQNARRLRAGRDIKFKDEDFFEKTFPEGSFAIINPPYDNRLELQNAVLHYQDIGDHMKNSMKGCTIWVFSGNLEAIKHIGLKAFKKIELMNGPIKSKLHGFQIYEGSKAGIKDDDRMDEEE